MTAVPPWWPGGVRPPGAPDWEDSAVSWLLDLVPGDWREHPVLVQRRSIPPPRVEKLPPLTEDELRTSKLLTTNNPADEDEELTNPGDFE